MADVGGRIEAEMGFVRCTMDVVLDVLKFDLRIVTVFLCRCKRREDRTKGRPNDGRRAQTGQSGVVDVRIEGSEIFRIEDLVARTNALSDAEVGD